MLPCYQLLKSLVADMHSTRTWACVPSHCWILILPRTSRSCLSACWVNVGDSKTKQNIAHSQQNFRLLLVESHGAKRFLLDQKALGYSGSIWQEDQKSDLSGFWMILMQEWINESQTSNGKLQISQRAKDSMSVSFSSKHDACHLHPLWRDQIWEVANHRRIFVLSWTVIGLITQDSDLVAEHPWKHKRMCYWSTSQWFLTMYAGWCMILLRSHVCVCSCASVCLPLRM